MTAKIAVVVVVVGAAFGALLVNRQQRIDVIAEIARSRLRMTQHRSTIARLQAAVAESVRPSELEMSLVLVAPKWQNVEYRFDPLTERRTTTTDTPAEPPKARKKTNRTNEATRQRARADHDTRR